jgi:serine/threonine-protein kinase
VILAMATSSGAGRGSTSQGSTSRGSTAAGPHPGLLLGERYRLEEPIAGGGMGTVWRATDELLARPMAVKLLRPELAADPQFLARFRAEARHAAAVRHPGVATVHDYGEQLGEGADGTADRQRSGRRTDPDDTVVDLRTPQPAPSPSHGGRGGGGAPTAWLVMDLVEGEPVSAVLAREGRLEPTRTLQLLAEAADALAAAHAVGVVHRDVKPGNLLLATVPSGPGGRPRVIVTDFGIARAAGAASITRTGMLVGTAAYLSPEQAAGRPASAASDLYALGVVAYECLAGHKPFAGDSDLAVALAHGRDPVPPLPDDVPAPVRALVLRLLAKDPQQRPASAAAVAARARLLAADPTADPTRELDPAPPTRVLPVAVGSEPGVREDEPEAAAPTGEGLPARDRPPRGHRPLLTGAVAAGMLLLGGLVAGALLGASHRQAPAAPAPSTARPSASATPTTTVRLDPASYVGQPVETVRAELARLGLAVRLVGTAAGGPVGTVAALEPTGVVARGTTVTLDVVQEAAQTGPAGTPGSKHGPKDEHGTKPGKGDRKGKG